MLSKCISANSRITQVVWQRIPHRRTAASEKARQAVALSRQRGTTKSRSGWLADRRCCRDATLETRMAEIHKVQDERQTMYNNRTHIYYMIYYATNAATYITNNIYNALIY